MTVHRDVQSPHLRFHHHKPSIHSLPLELLTHIFQLGAHTHKDACSGSDISEATDFTSAVSQVCLHWRHVALSNASLWSTIKYTINDFLPDYACTPGFSAGPQRRKAQQNRLPSGWLHRTSLSLSRSKKHPLRIHIDLRDPSWDFALADTSHPIPSTQFRLILLALLPHVVRWSSLTLISDTYEPIAYLLFHLGAYSGLNARASNSNLTSKSSSSLPPFPKLRRLELVRSNAYYCMPGEVFLPAEYVRGPGLHVVSMDTMPMLEHLDLTGVHIDWDHFVSSQVPQVEPSLRILSLKYHAQEVLPTLPTFVRLLSNCAKLRSLSIMGWGPSSIEVPSSGFDLDCDSRNLELEFYRGNIHLPDLETLEFGWIDASYARNVLSLFDLSVCLKLKRLHLEDLKLALDPTDIWEPLEMPLTANYSLGSEDLLLDDSDGERHHFDPTFAYSSPSELHLRLDEALTENSSPNSNPSPYSSPLATGDPILSLLTRKLILSKNSDAHTSIFKHLQEISLSSVDSSHEVLQGFIDAVRMTQSLRGSSEGMPVVIRMDGAVIASEV